MTEDETADWSDYSDVLDNREFDVAERANALAEKAKTVRIAVGYFFLGGFDLLKENLRETERIELLIGTDTDQRTIEELERGFAEDLNQFDRSEAQEGINRLYELIQEEKVDVRVYDDKRFHPKLYLFEEGSGTLDLGRAIIGSSNLSPSGLQGNVELNVEKKDNSTIRYLLEWFDDIWEEGSEFDKDLMTAAIERSQFGDDLPEPEPTTIEDPVGEVETISPYEATKRFIVEQFDQEVREGTLLEDITGEYKDQLTSFQQDAFRAARRPLEKYNGVVLADSVGLGKSFIGAPLVQEYSTSRDEVLVIAPKRLKQMWMDELLNADNGRFPTTANKHFISFNKLSRLAQEDIQRLRKVDLILIDEAHNLRNTGTKRYNKLQSLGRQGKKFIMLTATPIHNSVRDVNNVIKVFADDDDFDIQLRNLSPSEIFKQYDRLSSIEDKTPGEQNRISELEELIEKIMREVVISRDRKYILNKYDDITIGGEPITVPDRVPQLVTPDDPRLDEIYSDIVDTVIGSDDSDDSGLNIPYVSADRYDADGDEEEELIIEYQNASVLMLINLLKRLESSLAAFEVSVERLMKRERITQKIATGDLEDSKARDDAVTQISNRFEEGFAKDVNFEEVAEAIDRIGPSKREEIVADIDEDLTKLEQLKSQAQDALQEDAGGKSRDAKAERLKRLIERELSDEKVLVFSQYVPTITHLFEQLTGEDPAHTNVATLGRDPGNLTVAYVHGGGDFDRHVVERFAPVAQDADVGENEEIDILLATDVLGVGQNLQDARVIVNYDLHWNPMTMEQRIGRIDRITTQHDELLIYNFVPTGDLRKQLGLVERIEGKIDDIASTFGHAAPILDSAEEQVHKTLITYEKLQENEGSSFGDERLEGIGSKYDDLRNSVKLFCEENDVEIGELQATYDAVADRTESQYFVHHTDTGGYFTLTRLEHSSGRSEWRTTIFDPDKMVSTTIDEQTVFTQFARLQTDEVEVFRTIASADDTRHTIPEDEFDQMEAFAQELQSPSTWENDILTRQPTESDVLTDIRLLCQQVSDSGTEVDEKADEILEILDEREITDYAKNELRTIHRRRRRYGVNGTIRRLHHKLTEELQLVEPETVTDAEVSLVGQLEESESN